MAQFHFSPSISEPKVGRFIRAPVNAASKQVDKDICIHRVVIKGAVIQYRTGICRSPLLLKTIVGNEKKVEFG